MKTLTFIQTYKNKLYLSYYENNKKYFEKIDYNPSYFLETEKQSKYRGFITNKRLKKFTVPLKEYSLKILQNKKIYQNIYGVIDPEIQYISENNFDTDISKIIYCFFDIETYHPSHSIKKIMNYEGEIISITMYDNKFKKYIVLTINGNVNKEIKNNVLIKYCKNEKELLLKFIKYLKKVQPDILTGWNIENFDVPYIIERMRVNKINYNRLSFFNIVYKDERLNLYKILGINIIDYYILYKKFLPTHSPITPDNFKLDTILKLELGEEKGKIDYSEYRDIFEFYEKNVQKFIEYNIRDVEGLVELNKKKKLLELIINLSFLVGIPFNYVFSSIKTWYSFLYSNLKKKNIIIPKEYKYSLKENKGYTGAFVKDPITGIKKWVVVYDLNSLYPNIIIQWNIENGTLINKPPEELIELKKKFNINYFLKNYKEIEEKLKKYDMIFSPAGTFFKKNKKSLYAEYLKNIYSLRKKIKNEMLEERKKGNDAMELYVKQMSLKILLNSFYGCFGTEYFPFFDVRLAETITKTGQFIIKTLIKVINTKLSKLLGVKKDFIIFSDTDSIAICLEDFNKKNTYEFVDEFSKKHITPIIDKTLKLIFKNLNCIENRLQMKREKIANKVFNKAKKAYILSLIEEEGVIYKQPKIKIKGLQVIKSSTPILIRNYLMDDINYLMKTENINEEYFKNKYLKLKKEIKNKNLNEIAFPRTANNLEKWEVDIFQEKIKTGTPVHIKGVCLYNSLIRKYNLNTEPIVSKDKIFYVYLKENKWGINTFAWKYEYPKGEIFEKIKQYIDYNKQLETSYFKILENLLKTINIEFNISRKKIF